MVKKKIIWYDDHLTTRDIPLLDEAINILRDNNVEFAPAATQSQFVQQLKQFEEFPSSISGILLDLMLTTDHGITSWECLGAPLTRFEPYIAGRQVLEILKISTNDVPSYVQAYRNHAVAVLTSASDVIVLENIPKSQRHTIPMIFKDGVEGSDHDLVRALTAWVSGLPDPRR